MELYLYEVAGIQGCFNHEVYLLSEDAVRWGEIRRWLVSEDGVNLYSNFLCFVLDDAGIQLAGHRQPHLLEESGVDLYLNFLCSLADEMGVQLVEHRVLRLLEDHGLGFFDHRNIAFGEFGGMRLIYSRSSTVRPYFEVIRSLEVR